MAINERMRKQLAYRWNAVVGVIFTAMALVAYILNSQLDNDYQGYFSDIVLTLLIIGVAFMIVFGIGFGLSTLRTKGIFTRHHHEVVYRFVQLTTVLTALSLITISIWEFTVGDILIGAGVITVLLAVAARKTLGSILSGIIIMTTDIFRVGDWVKIDDRFGQIQHISLFNTQVLSPQGETHIFPNDEITTRNISNLAHNRYRNDVLIGIDYDSEIPKAIDVCNAVLEELTESDHNNVDGFNPTSIKSLDDSQITLAVKMWVRQPTPRAINQAQTSVLSELHQRFDDEKIEIPFPQRMVSERV